MVKTPINHGTNYLSTGAGFLPSTVVIIDLEMGFSIVNNPAIGVFCTPILGNPKKTPIIPSFTTHGLYSPILVVILEGETMINHWMSGHPSYYKP